MLGVPHDEIHGRTVLIATGALEGWKGVVQTSTDEAVELLLPNMKHVWIRWSDIELIE